MSRLSIGLSVFFVGVFSFLTCLSAEAQETMSTTVNPNTQETSTTTVNPDTQESTTTTVNPVTQETTITKINPDTQETTTTIITPVPEPKEMIPAPQGYASCFKVPSGWYKDIWVPEHTVCQYDTDTQNQYQGSGWVEGHWACTKYKASEGACTKWEWKPGHWVKTFQAY